MNEIHFFLKASKQTRNKTHPPPEDVLVVWLLLLLLFFLFFFLILLHHQCFLQNCMDRRQVKAEETTRASSDYAGPVGR